MGAGAGDVMLLAPPALRTWGWEFVGVWIFSGLYWTRFFSPAIYVLSLKFRLSQEYEVAAFKTGFRAEPDKPDKTASVTANFLPIIRCCGFMWLPERVSSDLFPPSTWGDPKLKQHRFLDISPFLHLCNPILKSPVLTWSQMILCSQGDHQSSFAQDGRGSQKQHFQY